MLGAGGVGEEITVGGRTGTPLWWAARACKVSHTSYDTQKARAVELATLLVEKGADVKAVGSDRAGNETTPLWWAARAVRDGRADAVELNMDMEGAAELATLLVEKGADVNAVGTLGNVYYSTQLW